VECVRIKWTDEVGRDAKVKREKKKKKKKESGSAYNF
jgi:hypothetical protein